MRIWGFSLLVLSLVVALGVDTALAGAELYCDTKNLLEGGVGTIIGTMVSLAGLLTFLRGGGFAGIIMIIAGTLVLFAPQLLTSLLTGMETGVSGTKRDGQGRNDGQFSINVPCR